jgi:hypothetical protein
MGTVTGLTTRTNLRHLAAPTRSAPPGTEANITPSFQLLKPITLTHVPGSFGAPDLLSYPLIHKEYC